jgi:molybdate transport system ATP-binding protein
MKLLLHKIELPLAAFTLRLDQTVEARVLGLCGPSGAGKTSLLDLIAGLRRARSAFIQIDDRLLTDTARGVHVPVRARAIGYVPQDLALFPHLPVRQNLLYGCPPKPPAGSPFGYDHVIEVLELSPLVGRSVRELSGGEQQRVALGRALLSAPKLLLLDEPLANLDDELRNRILHYLVRVRDEFPVPMVYVTHHSGELQRLCDTVIRIRQGNIETPVSPAGHPARP